MKKVKDPLAGPRKGNMRKLDMGGQVFTDRDYSKIFKRKSTKGIVIILLLTPFCVGIPLTLWLSGFRFVAIALLLITLLVSTIVYFASRVN